MAHKYAHMKGRYAHRVIAEAVLGRPLPPKAEVHHVNENPRDNRPENLVICEDRAYHRLLHVRAAALQSCGNPNWRLCGFCHQHDSPLRLKRAGIGRNGARGFFHPSCKAKWMRDWKKRRTAE